MLDGEDAADDSIGALFDEIGDLSSTTAVDDSLMVSDLDSTFDLGS